MRTTRRINGLTVKQYCQVIDLCAEFQPHVLFREVAFLELVEAAKVYCNPGEYVFFCDKKTRFQKLLIGTMASKIKSHFYFDGIKFGNRNPKNVNWRAVEKYIPRVMTTPIGKVQPIEMVLFMKIVRACRDFLRAEMKKEAEATFFQKLNVVYDAMA
ncbi:MAG: hypothetical protein HFJ94_10160 [Muribaculaceae bacterium]|nr:hypothetical protein [Muribaculaceae bacterium]